MRRLELTESARLDLKSIRRYSGRIWAPNEPIRYLADLRDTMKALRSGALVGRERDDLRSGLRTAASGRHRIFFVADVSRIFVVRVLHEKMDYRRHLENEEPPPND